MLEKLNPTIQLVSDRRYFKFAVLFLLFLLLVFDQSLATIFLLILLGDFVWFIFDKHISYPMEKIKNNRIVTFTIAGIVAIVFFLSTAFLLTAFTGSTYSMMSVMELLATTSPVLAGNIILTFISFGILIPFIESHFFHGTLVEGLMLFLERRLGIRINRYSINIGTILIAVVVSALFLLYHLTSKNLSNIPLLVTFIFSMFATLITIKTKEKKGAIILHCIVNILSLLGSYGLLSTL
jgi:membrane protease YdiL (CAAX protease family)